MKKLLTFFLALVASVGMTFAAITVRLDPSSCTSWSTVRLWAWTDNGNIFDSWPGQIVSLDSDGWYSYTFDASFTSVNILWNNGNDQTIDITNVSVSTCFALIEQTGIRIGVNTVDCTTGQYLSTTGNHVPIGDLYYNLSTSGNTAEVTYGNYKFSSVTIPSSVIYNGISYTVTSIGGSAFRGCTGLTSVTIPNSVTSIGGYAFEGCKSLTSVTIPNSVKSIGKYAFYECDSLTSVTINSDAIVNKAYTYSDNLSDVFGSQVTKYIIGDNVKGIGEYAFSGCSSLISVTIGDGVTSIGTKAFDGCSSITSPVYNAHCFAYMPKSYSGAYVIPEGIKQIAGGAFSGCSSLTSVTIGNSVTSIGMYAFSGCSSLTSINVDANNSNYSSTDGVLFNKDKTTLIAYPRGEQGAYTIPNSVTSIGEYAFYECSSLTFITIPNSVTSIGGSAFYGCTGLIFVAFEGLTPPTMNSSVFQNTNNCPIYVPCGAKEAYVAALNVNNTIDESRVISPQNLGLKTIAEFLALKSPIDTCILTGVVANIVMDSNDPTQYNEYGNFDIVDETGTLYVYGLLTAEGQTQQFRTMGVDAGDTLTVMAIYNEYNSKPQAMNAIFISLKEGNGSTPVETADVVFDKNDFAGQGVSTTGGPVSATKNGVTFTCDKGFGDGQHGVRCYKGSTVTITSATEQIGKMVFEFDYVNNQLYDGGGMDPEVVVNAKEWTVTLPSQARMNKISIYFGTAEDVGYTGTCGDNLRWTLSNGTLIISGTGAMEDYYYNVVSPWYDYRSSIKSVIINDGVTSIGKEAFYYCTSLTSVTIPNSVTSIGHNTFYNCSKLSSITIPNSVISIGDGAFKKTGIYNDNANWENDVLYINDCLISAKESILSAYTIKAGTRLIANRAFYKCSSLTSITIPNSVTSIGSLAFYGCSSLTSVAIGNSVTSIGSSAFNGCSSLTSVTIGNSVTSIGSSTFNGCSKLTSVTINSDAIVNKAYTSSSNLSDIFGSQVTKYIIGDNVKGIGKEAFYWCDSLTSVTIGNSVKSIGNSAFYHCSSLTSVTIGNGVTSIGNSAFAYCSLTSITIPNSVISIGDGAFSYCSLTSITIPNSVISIGDGAFNGCSSLTSPVYNAHCFAYMPTSYSGAYTIPEGIKQIAGRAFSGCKSLTSVTIPNSVTSIGKEAFFGCSSLSSVTVETETPPTIGNHVFYVYDYDGNYKPLDITIIYVPCGTIETYRSAWSGYASRIKYKPLPITIETKVNNEVAGRVVAPKDMCDEMIITAIPNSGYKFTKWSDGNTDNPRSFVLQEGLSLTAIFDYVLSGKCGKDSALTWTLDTTTMALNITGSGALSENYTYAPFIQSLTIGNSVISIGYGAFSRCSSLTSVTIGNSVTSIGENAFSGCSSLTSATIPNSVTSIGYGAFSECSSLTSITIPNSVTSIGWYAFGECESLKTVILGSSVKVLETAAFAYCSSIDTITCYSQRPPTVKQDALYGLDYSTIVYVPASYLNYYVIHDAWGLYDVRPMGIALTLSANNAAYGTLVGAGTYAQNATVTFSAKPNNGYHFARWSDGNTENPRTIILTQDTTFTAVFETSKSGVCGHNNALQWTYDGQSRTLTITGRAALDENYTFGVEALTQMRTLIIGNDVTAIGDSAFYGVSSIYHLEIGANVASIGNYTFAECRRLEDITCYAEDVPVINATTFDNVGNKQYIYLYVPDGRERAYKRDEFWGEFDVQVKGAETVSDPVDDVIVNPSDNTADITWPVVNNAGTYEITITKDDVVVCTLIFNANGQLAGIAFAPGKEGRAHYAQAATLTANGFRFTITGLTSATKYGYSVVSKNTSNAVVDTKSGTFTTTGSQQVPTNLDQIGSSQDGTKGRLILHNGKIFILRNGKTYTMQGQEVK